MTKYLLTKVSGHATYRRFCTLAIGVMLPILAITHSASAAEHTSLIASFIDNDNDGDSVADVALFDTKSEQAMFELH